MIERSLPSAELGIVYGRRRVGKSSLLQQFIKGPNDYFFEALQNGNTPVQIQHFMKQLADHQGTLPMLAHRWQDAFDAFSKLISKGKHFVVFDELPWMAAGREELVALIKYYWDNSWKRNTQLTLVLCGSVASFMVKHVVHSKALHNRKTFEIRLDPLRASEAKDFFGPSHSPFEIIKFLMVFGGIPKYLEQIDTKKSLFQNVDGLCFQKNGFFVKEFETLFKEQFRSLKTYQFIVQNLACGGLSREKLAQSLSKISGGGFAEYLNNLEQADFIKSWKPFSPKSVGSKTRRYTLWDDWLHFYFTYMESNRTLIANNERNGLFEGLASKSFDTNCGLAFERLCLKNFVSILDALDVQISQLKGFGPFFRQGSRKELSVQTAGMQIDILAQRQDNTLMLFECKFKGRPVGKEVIREVEQKINFLGAPKIFSIEKYLLAPSGVTTDLEDAQYFNAILDSKALFT